MSLTNPTKTIFYLIEKSIKDFRKSSQKSINEVINDITLDQCLIIMILNDNSNLSQKEIATLIYKDYASITRMIELMVKKKYLKRTINESDRRRFNLEISDKGKESLKILTRTIKENRKKALLGISKKELAQLEVTLNKIILNCK